MVQRRKTNNDRIWQLGQQAARRCSQNLAREIEKTQKGITTQELNNILNCLPNYIGCFAENQFSNITINQFPAFIIANVDSYHMKGSHWLAIGIFENTIEIFDPLGFTIFNWNRIPCSLLNFLHRMSVTRKVIVCPRIQPSKSHLCGYYCIFYFLLRSITTMRRIMSYFYIVNSKLYRNELLLSKFFK